MSKGIGIASLVFGILAIFVPVVSLYVVWLALGLAGVAAFAGDRTFSVATLLICLVNVIFLSPATILELEGVSFLKTCTIVFFIAPVAGLIICSRKSSVLF